VVAADDSVDGALLGVLGGVGAGTLEVVTIYYGAGVSEQDALALADRVRALHPGVTVDVVRGGQAHYPYIVSLE
jgi:dihydroxyacetone kinase-like predicted kinase